MILSWSSSLNKLVAPFLLRHGLSLRWAIGRGVLRDNPTLDALLLIPLAQKLLSLEVHQDVTDAVKARKKRPTAFEKWAESTFDRIFGTSGDDTSHRPESSNENQDSTEDDMDLKQSRLKTLESYLRPVLVPNERWSDVLRWHFHHRFLKWARTEFLVAKYGTELQEALTAYPRLRHGPQLAHATSKRSSLFRLLFTRNDPAVNDDPPTMLLPFSDTVVKAFQMQRWNRQKDIDAGWKRLTKITKQLGGQVMHIHGESGLRVAMVPHETDVSGLSLEDLLEVTGGHVSYCGAFNLLCEELDIYQFWTKEYIDLLASYLLERTNEFDGDTVVLDVGAGDGLLIQLLRNAMLHDKPKRGGTSDEQITKIKKKQNKMPTLVATDDGSWRIPPQAPVERLSVAAAVAKYAGDDSHQLIVLCSWMPMGQDWTGIFREHNVDEYILIGEYNDGNCGDNWATWGNTDYCLQDDSASGKIPIPPYQQDGFRRKTLKSLSQYHFARFDSSASSSTSTVAFSR